MSDISFTKFENFLNNFTENDWLEAIDQLLPEIHEVDRNAVQIWFRFFPLALFRYLQSAENKDETVAGFVIQGDYELKEQIDTSHAFLYGHRYWKTVKAAIVAEAKVFTNQTPTLIEEIKQIGILVAEKLKVERPLVNGIVAVGLMTLNQVGLDAFSTTDGQVEKPSGLMSKSPDQIIRKREEDDSQGIFGFLRTVDKKYSIRYADARLSGKFDIVNDEEIASASAKDQSENWKENDDRCWEGVVPVECRSASCGTCWIGVLGGQEKLSEVAVRERRQMKVFGYNQPDDPKPFLRLACQARATGNATIVIPPWNGVFGKKVYDNVEYVELEPATTSAKATRNIVKEAVKNELL